MPPKKGNVVFVRPSYSNKVHSLEMYNFYMEDKPFGTKAKFPIFMYNRICSDANEMAMSYVIDGINTLKLPSNMGEIRVLKRKINYNMKLRIDFNETIKTYGDCSGKKVYFTNEHTNGFFYGVHWVENKCVCLHRRFWKFRASRDNKRNLNAAILNGNDYFEDIKQKTF